VLETHVPVVVAQASKHAVPVGVVVVAEHRAPRAEQALPVQQSWFASPQAVQEPFEQTVSLAVQVFPEQQSWFAPPQAGRWLLS
jgi:hypothetical protein